MTKPPPRTNKLPAWLRTRSSWISSNGGCAKWEFNEPRRSAREHLERMPPVVPEEPGKAPQHAQGLDGSCRYDASAIVGLPAKLADDRGDLRLRLLAVAA